MGETWQGETLDDPESLTASEGAETEEKDDLRSSEASADEATIRSLKQQIDVAQFQSLTGADRKKWVEPLKKKLVRLKRQAAQEAEQARRQLSETSSGADTQCLECSGYGHLDEDTQEGAPKSATTFECDECFGSGRALRPASSDEISAG